jgi:diguanylate cyclase (GGDEF)-like protein/PAS domain S-box-containing protein
VYFINHTLLPLVTLDKSYDPFLIVLSIIIAIISSFTAFGSSERIHACTSRVQKILWGLFGAISMGTGIWAMHFIGSLALQLPGAVSYKLNISLISVLPAILASSAVLWLMNKAEFELKRLLLCGLLLGLGMSAMHFIGMSAMVLNAKMVYIKSFFMLSIMVAVILATMSLKIKFEASLHNRYQFFNKQQGISSVIMGFAVSGMHYTAMYAVAFIPTETTNYLETEIDASVLVAIISIVVLLVLLVALIVPHMLRFKEMVKILQKNEEELKIAAISFQTHEAIMVTDENQKIVRVNEAFTRIMGYSEAEVLGRNPKILSSGKQDELFYKNFWNTIHSKGKWNGEIWNRRKNGEIFPAWQTVSVIKDNSGKVTHYIAFFSDITDFKLAEKEIEKLAFYDSLTELPNRRLLHERLEQELNNARRYQRAGILLFLDLDRFKHINDALGHSVGDKILIETARRLQSLLRATDTAVRLGGDEFIILISAQDGIHNDLLEQSSIIAEKVINEINNPFLINEHELFISTSIGITLYTGIDETVELLLKRADTAMYQAKEAGRDTFRFYQQSMQEAADTKLQIERSLRLAISKQELSLHYQPQLSDKNKLIGVEALIRWNNSDLGFIPPIEFIPIAEESGLIIPIGHWIVERVCNQINQWDEQGIDIPHVAINISAKQFYHVDFVSMLVHTVFENTIRPDRIILEITESVFLGELEDVIDKMNALKENGFSFSVDDFGTGYSSLTYLKRLPFDQLKIDQAFIRDMVNQPSDVAIVKAIIVMAKGLGLELIAEGVETDEHLAYLSNFGCNIYQGYYFSKPLPADQLSEYIKTLVQKN